MSNRKGLYSNLHPIISPLGAEPIYGSYSNEQTVNSVIQHYEDQGFMKRRNKSERAEDRSKLEALSLMSLEGALTPDFLNAFMGYEYFNRKDYGSDKDYLKSQPRYITKTAPERVDIEPKLEDPRYFKEETAKPPPVPPAEVPQQPQQAKTFSSLPDEPTETSISSETPIVSSVTELSSVKTPPMPPTTTTESKSDAPVPVGEAGMTLVDDRIEQDERASFVAEEGASLTGMPQDVTNIIAQQIQPADDSEIDSQEAERIGKKNVKALASPKATTEPTEDQQVTPTETEEEKASETKSEPKKTPEKKKTETSVK
ncbi:hypothetical protein, partial [Neptunomonas phycophila]|uniref:hypothetical protein n=1 Tax=Neptunomonas phycophila TaxID=1572645 RepID=UPI0023F90B5F